MMTTNDAKGGDVVRPVLFLDVDGVVNAIPGRNGLPRRLAGRYTRTTVVAAGTPWPIHYDPDVVHALNALAREQLVDVVWLTTWEDFARTALAPALGLDDWPVIPMPAKLDTAGRPSSTPLHSTLWWKIPAILNATSDGRPFAWVDDDMTKDMRTRLRLQRPQPSWLARPFTQVGVTLEHLDQLRQFATTLTATSPTATPPAPASHIEHAGPDLPAAAAAHQGDHP